MVGVDIKERAVFGFRNRVRWSHMPRPFMFKPQNGTSADEDYSETVESNAHGTRQSRLGHHD